MARYSKIPLFNLLFLSILGLIVSASTVNAASDKITIYVVNYPLKYFAGRIAGEHASVAFPAPAEEDPAYWMPDAETIAAYQQADLILLNGANYAKWVNKTSLPPSKLVNTSAKFKDRYAYAKEMVTHSHGAEGKHAHESLAFTLWIDFDLAAKQAKAIAKALDRKRPGLKDTFQKNYLALERDLSALDLKIQNIVSKNQPPPLIGSHPVYDYFSKRYGLNMKSVHWEPDEVPGNQQWMDLQGVLKTHPARWMIWEGNPNQETVKKLESMGINSLVFDPCGNVPAKGDFMSVMRRNVENLRKAF
ncbi:MAG: zinc ABC transporter substrate-binding protein [Deltaproteobacteria bacterium]|nr:zinc ABC transporter substrate-binding protein [Deltaproteobacteria bacterium]